ncbi:sulfate adenylyltransferase subunit CysN [Salinivibrio sp. EAGSL]|jgi:sulfate adenylyltransferase subunit 1 (EC 2.7.7.4)|uniref:sulfate adenylyltransferase subunit CysN n=1 Tax=Salinivibrio sp. EAGSL TaxID=2738468 RepID=UPI00158A7E28|nr:sulfate adenylyltransferase subunit CysN [Salinivibrio sp. EAGSL]NUY55689.1 sulfate adenylyltransferase subunit CysN [Salinivibrio sp. EAGSL]
MNPAIQQQVADLGIEGYLQQHQHKSLLRFLTCGSVDDGKSTLIGRLLHDSQQIYEDQLAAVHADSQRVGTTGEKPDLALLVDGLQAEREQGITIDVAYRYFSTSKRKFIIADTPGHEQYTRNMATGASTCDVAVILIDARHGILDQTRRHSYIANLLGIQHFVVAVNKMDLVAYSQARFNEIQEQYLAFADQLNPGLSVSMVPLSALEGDNVVNASDAMAWYQGEPLLSQLEAIDIEKSRGTGAFRFPVQYVNRPDLNFRGYAGTLASGELHVGDEVKVLPSGLTAKVARIVTFDGDRQFAFSGQAVTLTLDREIDISRGDLLVRADDDVAVGQRFDADVVWMTQTPLASGREYDIQLASKKTSAQVEALSYGVDVNTLNTHDADTLPLNGIGRCTLTLSEAVPLDTYYDSPNTGGFILIDRLTNVTVGAGMIRHVAETQPQTTSSFSAFELELNQLIRKHFPHWQARDLGLLG